MKYLILIAFLLYGQSLLFSQTWKVTKIKPLPINNTENSICEAIIGNKKYVYSFGGIKDSFSIESIHKHVYKYSIEDDEWYSMPNVPDTMGKVGSSASFVNNKIYLIGGKYITSDSTEVYSDKVHIFNPSTDEFEPAGQPVPEKIAYHVQTVWKDSLIFVFSGKSSIGNTLNVHIYNPFFDSWSQGTQIPANPNFETVNASGYILGDTIYYFGGEKSENNEIVASNTFRKGIINPANPTEINWILGNPISYVPQFKGASSGQGNTLIWVGGAYSYYNLDSLINGSYSASLTNLLIQHSPKITVSLFLHDFNLFNIRSIAKIGGGNWIVAGGIDTLKQISNQAFLLHNSDFLKMEYVSHPPLLNISEDKDYFKISTENVGYISVYDLSGRMIYNNQKQLANLWIHKSNLQNGILFFSYDDGVNLPVVIKRFLSY
ncbi:MAG: hypothetical protein WC994_01865 [Brumimicrobium sp.]